MIAVALFTLAAVILLAAFAAIVFAIWWRGQNAPTVQTPALHFVRGWKPLNPEQIATTLNAWAETDPHWRAVWDLLSRHIEDELGPLMSIKPDPFAIVQANGRIQALLFLRSQMLQFRKKG